jgi:hypothetical protein
MITFKSPFIAVGALTVSALLAGCGGSGATPVSNSGTAVAPQTQLVDASMNKCSSDNGVSVKPCRVTLTVSDPEQTVTTKGPKNGTFTLKDMRCTKKDVAEVAGSGNTYTVTVGTATGMCIAKFVDRDSNSKKIGTAKLSITNQV